MRRIAEYLIVPVLAMIVSGCAPDIENFNQAPLLSPVGAGVGASTHEPTVENIEAVAEPVQGWVGGHADFFRDARAVRKGDLITVRIEIDDSATLNNTSNRSKRSSADAGVDFTYDIMDVVKADINGEGELSSNSSSSGRGTTERSERIELSVAALVTRVMPNGYLLIEGSQEVVVNFEQRTLHVSGLIRPVDIAPDNSISYEKIAEARIAYGGSGRLTEVQQPGWGQQIWDRVSPF